MVTNYKVVSVELAEYFMYCSSRHSEQMCTLRHDDKLRMTRTYNIKNSTNSTETTFAHDLCEVLSECNCQSNLFLVKYVKLLIVLSK